MICIISRWSDAEIFVYIIGVDLYLFQYVIKVSTFPGESILYLAIYLWIYTILDVMVIITFPFDFSRFHFFRSIWICFVILSSTAAFIITS